MALFEACFLGIGVLLLVFGTLLVFAKEPAGLVLIAGGILAIFIASDREALSNSIREELLSWALVVFVGFFASLWIYDKIKG